MFGSNPSGRRLLLFGGGLPPPIFSNRFASSSDSDGLLKLFPSKFPNGFTSSGLLKLLLPANKFPPFRFLNGCHPRLLIPVLYPNIPNPIFWLLSCVASVVMPNILSRFSNIIPIN